MGWSGIINLTDHIPLSFATWRYLEDEAGLVFLFRLEPVGLSPLRPVWDDVCRLSNPDISLLLSYGLEGYLMEAVDVRVDVEALIRRCCRTFRTICLETLVSAGVVVSSLIFGESRK